VDVRIDEEALRALGVTLVVAFGSRARPAARRGSDLDLGVLFAPGGPCADPTAVIDALESPVELDVVFLNDADPLLLMEVARDGRPLFEAVPGTFEEFRLRAIKRYLDTAWIREVEAEALRSRLR
jgi:predicted nucleotidyltransferase